MKERPILFSGAMVRALLDGSKTQTRRVVKGFALELLKPGNFTPEYVALPENGNSPYGYAGDRLWVRETHDVRIVGTERFHSDRCVTGIRHYAKVAYRADDGRAEVDIDEATFERLDETESKGWAPSIHMPRWASRITLEVTGVRVERLQDISETDAVAEGIRQHDQKSGWVNECILQDGKRHFDSSAYGMFQQLWASINGADSWEANPWVWVVEFKRVTP